MLKRGGYSVILLGDEGRFFLEKDQKLGGKTKWVNIILNY